MCSKKERILSLFNPLYCIFVLLKKYSMLSLVNIFRIVALLEGISYILLLFIATPIKYLANDPQYVKLLGMPHGFLFILYIILAFMLKTELKWTAKIFARILLASIIPFGTFFIGKYYLNTISNG